MADYSHYSGFSFVENSNNNGGYFSVYITDKTRATNAQETFYVKVYLEDYIDVAPTNVVTWVTYSVTLINCEVGTLTGTPPSDYTYTLFQGSHVISASQFG